MKTIWKVMLIAPFDESGMHTQVLVQKGAKFLCAKMEKENIFLYYMYEKSTPAMFEQDTPEEWENRIILALSTGGEIGDRHRDFIYIDSLELPDGLLAHIFEEKYI